MECLTKLSLNSRGLRFKKIDAVFKGAIELTRTLDFSFIANY